MLFDSCITHYFCRRGGNNLYANCSFINSHSRLFGLHLPRFVRRYAFYKRALGKGKHPRLAGDVINVNPDRISVNILHKNILGLMDIKDWAPTFTRNFHSVVHAGEVIEFEVSGDKIEAIHMLPGYAHNIINLSDTENLVTIMWANEQFEQAYPDTFYEKV